MDNMVLWLIIGTVILVAGISVILLQKKAGDAKKYRDERDTLKSQLDSKERELLDIERERVVGEKELQSRVDGLSRELKESNEQNTQLSEELEDLKAFQTGQADGLDKLETELSAVKEQLRQAEEQRDKSAAQLAERSRKEAESTASGDVKLQEEVAALKAQLEEKERKLASVEKDFAAQMDEVVQSSIQKITHAEQAKEEAIQAAGDNFDAAAEANAKLKAAEKKIAQLQG